MSAAPPTRKELDAAKIGEAPEQEVAQLAATWVLDHALTDPGTEVITYEQPVSRAYFANMAGQSVIAWTLLAHVRDRTQSGDLGVERLWEFYFVADAYVGHKMLGDTSYGFTLSELPAWPKFKEPQRAGV